MPHASRPLLALLALALLGGCDTDNPSSPLSDLEGTYVFTELLFDPSQPQVLDDVDVLAELDPSDTSVEIFSEGPALVRFRFEGEPNTVRADMNVSASSSTVTMSAATEADAVRLSRLLLPPTLTLSRGTNDQRLTGEIGTTANLEAFDPDQYGGLTAQSGTLYVTLDRESD